MMPFVVARVQGSEFRRDFIGTKHRIDAGAFAEWQRATLTALTFMRRNGYRDRTGVLSASMRSDVQYEGPLRYRSRVGAYAKYALFVDQPTRAHEIRARRAPNLVFWWEKMGVLFVGKRVMHPGTKGALFSEMTAKHMIGRFQVGTQVAVDRAVGGTG